MAGQKIFPFIWYKKEAEEAAAFYASIFPDSHVDSVTPFAPATPEGPPGGVKIVDFTLLGQRFHAMSAEPGQEFNESISMMVLCDNQAEIDRYWDALLDGGGKPLMCGWLIDRFGVRWQIVPATFMDMIRDEDSGRANRVAAASISMVKFDIAALEDAYKA